MISFAAARPVVAGRRAAPARAAPRAAVFGNARVLSQTVSASGRGVRAVVSMKGADPVSGGYAAALAETAKAAGALEAVHNDAEALAGYMKANSAIAAFLKNPVIDDKKKKDIVTKIVREGSFSPIFANFLNLLVDKRRMQLVGNIVEEFEVIYCNLTDTQVATVTSAMKLENEQQFQIAKKLQEITGAKNIKLKPEVDTNLIGGFVVRFGKDGSGYIDLSIKGAVEKITGELQPAA